MATLTTPQATLRIDGRDSTAEASSREIGKVRSTLGSALQHGLIARGATLYMPRHAVGLDTLSSRKPYCREYWQVVA